MLVHPLCRLSNIKPVLSWRLTSAENCSMASSLHSPVLRRPLSSDSGSALMKTLTRAILGCLLAYAIWLVSSPRRYRARFWSGPDVFHNAWVGIYSASNCSKAWGFRNGTVHYNKPLKSFDKSRADSRCRASVCRDIAKMDRKRCKAL